MPRGKKRTLRDIQNFIRKGLSDKLLRDLRQLKIVKEADIECASYYHLRKYIGEDAKWRVLARKHVHLTGHYVDLLLFNRYRPAVALELKWGQASIGKKDRRSLAAALAKLRVQKAYWLSATYSSKVGVSLKKKAVESGRLHQVIVPLGLTKTDLEDWKARRAKLRSGMAKGRGRRTVERSSYLS